MIGLLGGIGPFATACYYERLVSLSRRRGRGFPEILVVSLDFDRFTALENLADRQPYEATILQGLRRLAAAGARFAAMAANSPHAVFDRLERQSPLPLVSIVDPVLEVVDLHRYRSALLLGIRATTESDVYRRPLGERGVEVVVPSSDEQDRLESVIFGELGEGLVRPESRREVLEIVRGHPADAVLLACTELPLLLGPSDLEIPVIDTLDLHVAALVDRAAADERRLG